MKRLPAFSYNLNYRHTMSKTTRGFILKTAGNPAMKRRFEIWPIFLDPYKKVALS